MSVCCLPYTQAFSNVATTSIVYSDALKSKYGVAPIVEVFYYDEDYNEYTKSPYPGIRIEGGMIMLDYGGLATGFVKIS